MSQVPVYLDQTPEITEQENGAIVMWPYKNEVLALPLSKLDQVESPVLDEYETRIILDETLSEDLPSKTLKKLKNLNLADYLDSLSRNLKVFFE